MSNAIVSQGGREVVPEAFSRKAGGSEGDEVIWTEVDGQIVLTSHLRQVEQARQFFDSLMVDYQGPSLADELVAERRAGVARETGE